VRIEAAGGDEPVRIGRELRIGLQLARLLETLLRDVRGEIEQQRGDAGVRAMQRDLRAHGAGAEHGDRIDWRMTLGLLRHLCFLRPTGA
jgi:hypothetical protein